MTTMTADKLKSDFQSLSEEEQGTFRAWLADSEPSLYVLTPEDEAACDEADAQIARGEVYDAAEVLAELRASRG